MIVVDNGSTDIGLIQNDDKYNQIKWLFNNVRNPYTSRNIGVERSAGQIIAFLDAKCQPTANWVQQAVTLLCNKRYTVLAGRYEIKPYSDLLKDQLYGLLYLNNKKNVSNKYGVTSGNLWLHRETMLRNGPFDDHHISGNDIAWSLRALSEGYDIVYADRVVVLYPGQSFTQLKKSIRKYMSGIAYQHKRDQRNISESLKYFVMNLVPLRRSTFLKGIRYRRLEGLSLLDKCYLWLYAWRLKTIMAVSYLRALISI